MEISLPTAKKHVQGKSNTGFEGWKVQLNVIAALLIVTKFKLLMNDKNKIKSIFPLRKQCSDDNLFNFSQKWRTNDKLVTKFLNLIHTTIYTYNLHSHMKKFK